MREDHYQCMVIPSSWKNALRFNDIHDISDERKKEGRYYIKMKIRDAQGYSSERKSYSMLQLAKRPYKGTALQKCI